MNQCTNIYILYLVKPHTHTQQEPILLGDFNLCTSSFGTNSELFHISQKHFVGKEFLVWDLMLSVFG